MCTLVLRRPDAAWPLLLAANRDELRGRPSRAPGRHWPDRPHVRGGLDLEAGGTWLGVNDDGVVAAVLNRRGTLGPQPGKRSRGELVLEALDHAEAYHAAEVLRGLDPWPGGRSTWWSRTRLTPFGCGTRATGGSRPPDPGRRAHDRGRRARRLRLAADRPVLPQSLSSKHLRPGGGDWSAWQALLAARASPTGDPRDAMCIVSEGEYGTVSSALLALPRHVTEPPVYLHADGRPGEIGFQPVPV